MTAKSSFTAEDTIAAIASPKGEGAIAVVRISGQDSVGIAESLITLSEGIRLSELDSWRAALGTFGQNEHQVDQVIVTLFRAPRSFTGEDLVEISCHGGPVIVRRIVDLLFQAGARPAEPGEFSQRAYLNGKLDLLQAEAIAEIISARTSALSESALGNLQGKLSAQVRRMREALLDVSASLEVAIDHTDDPTVGTALTLREIKAKIKIQMEHIGKLILSYDYGRLMKDGLKVAIVGKPNAGKSSLLNAILGSERAIVSALPGTTRDTIEESFDLFGIPALLVDTAGLRAHTLDPIEKIGMDRTRGAIQSADAAIVMIDSSSEVSDEDARLADLVKGKLAVIALSKADLPQRADSSRVEAFFPGRPSVSISALRNEGVAALLKTLHAGISSSKIHSDGDFVITSLRHKNCLAQAHESLAKAVELLDKDGEEECVSLEVREAQESLSELAGETATEDILNKVFSSFCVGK